MAKISSIRKKGMSPGSLIFTGEQKVKEARITVIEYSASSYNEIIVNDPDELAGLKESKSVCWINVAGLHEVDKLARIGEIFGIHSLLVEDILNINHMPKIEDHPEFIFIISKVVESFKKTAEISIEQVSFVLGKNYLLTFQENVDDIFDPIRERLKESKGRIRKQGSDYLMYRLLDTITDNYLFFFHFVDERIEEIEDELLDNPDNSILEDIHEVRKEIIELRHVITPFREVIYSLQKEVHPLILKSTNIFLKDIDDHVKDCLEKINSLRDVLNSLIEVYRSSSAYRLNEILKILTIISTIFIPLTFIAGIYGMNFNTAVSKWNMPELNWYFGYPFVLILMIFVAAALLLFFKKKKWL
jgi:magnesium transporter